MIKNGPVCAFMTVYEDLYDYDGKSIYKHSPAAKELGGHSVVIYGYCDAGVNTQEPGMDETYWYILNS